MNYKQILKLQRLHGVEEMQSMINTGQCWLMEGSVGRAAMRALQDGACMLPKSPKRDYYGNRIPSRDELKAGTVGSFQHCSEFWKQIEEAREGEVSGLGGDECLINRP